MLYMMGINSLHLCIALHTIGNTRSSTELELLIEYEKSYDIILKKNIITYLPLEIKKLPTKTFIETDIELTNI